MRALATKVAPLWAVASFIDPVPWDDPRLVKVVHGDAHDLPVLSTGLAMFPDPLLGPLPTKILVSNNTRHFKPGDKPFVLQFKDKALRNAPLHVAACHRDAPAVAVGDNRNS